MKKVSLSMLFFVALLLWGCNKDGLVPSENISGKEYIKTLPIAANMLRAGQNPGNLGPKIVSQGAISVRDSVLGDIRGVLIERTRIFKAGVVFDEYMLFNPMTGGLYPGHCFVGNTIATGQYAQVQNQVIADITIASDLTPMQPFPGFKKTIRNIRNSNYVTTLGEWRSHEFKYPSMRTIYQAQEVHSIKEFGLKVGVNYSDESVTVGGEFQFDHSKEVTHVMVKFVQNLFTVSMDEPNGIILEQCDKSSLNGVMPVYISDIFYGRMAYALISSKHTYNEIVAALKLFVPEANLTIDTQMKYKAILDNSRIQAVIIGGTDSEHGNIITGGWKGFKETLAAQLPVSSASPVSFNLKYVDDNTLARTVYTGEYPILESYFVPECEEIKFETTPSSIEAKLGPAKNKDGELYGYVHVALPDGSEVNLFDVESKEYIAVKTQVPIDIFATYPKKEFVIKRPAGMSMKDFLKQKVTFIMEIRDTGKYGLVKGTLIGEINEEVTIEDLIFFAEHGTITVTAKVRKVIDRWAKLGFNIKYKCN